MKIILFANTDWYLYNFRLALSERLRDEGWEVVLTSSPGEYGERLQKKGFRWISLPFSTRSANPFYEFSLFASLIKLYRQERPQVVHHFTIKCVIYGSLAAKLTGGIKIVNAVTGLGHIFTDSGMKAKLLRPFVKGLYRLALGGERVRTVFQNCEDRETFIKWGLVAEGSTTLIRGSGVDLEKFSERGTREAGREKVKILFASRLLREKGVVELVEAFDIARDTHPQIELVIAGDLYPENPSSLTAQDVEKLKVIIGVTFLGHVDDMQSLLRNCDVVVLPSYAEGTPRILIEAAAMELPIVTTDIAGCRGLVMDGVNGFLVPVKSVDPLATALHKLILDCDLRKRMGRAGRQIVLAGFDQQSVNTKNLDVYQELISVARSA
jgi:glycosyltransferase involved in cell wall biosynthesis